MVGGQCVPEPARPRRGRAALGDHALAGGKRGHARVPDVHRIAQEHFRTVHLGFDGAKARPCNGMIRLQSTAHEATFAEPFTKASDEASGLAYCG